MVAKGNQQKFLACLSLCLSVCLLDALIKLRYLFNGVKVLLSNGLSTAPVAATPGVPGPTAKEGTEQ